MVGLFCQVAQAVQVDQAMRYNAEREGLHKCVVRVVCGRSAGTGAVVESEHGALILTAAHVVGSATEATISDGTRTVKVHVIHVDTKTDTAIMIARDIEMMDVVAAPMLGRAVRAGEYVQHCGFGGSGKLESTQGKIISIANGRITATGEGVSGDSGSPFFVDGKIAGILTHKTTYSTQSSRGIFGRVRYGQSKPAFIGTASMIIMAIMNMKPIIEKIIKIIRAIRAYRQPVLGGFIFGRRCNPSPEVGPQEDAPIPPPIPEPEKKKEIEDPSISPWWIAAPPVFISIVIIVALLVNIRGILSNTRKVA